MSWWTDVRKNVTAVALAPVTGGLSLLGLENKDGDPLIGDITGANSAKKANQQNIELQDKTNTEAINLANTAHQREVRDLIAAGLNPILSAGGSGAATPTLGTAQVQNELPGGLMGQAGQAVQMVNLLAQAHQSTAQAELNNQQAINTKTDTQYMPAMKKAEIAAQYANAGNAKAQADYTNVMKDVDTELKKAQTQKAKTEKESQEWENQINKDLGTSKNEWGPMRAIKNSARSLFDNKYNPFRGTVLDRTNK